MSQKIKDSTLSLLNKAGVFRFVRLVNKSQIRILAYHRFGEGYFRAKCLERQIEYLKKHYNIIDLESCLAFLCGKKQLPTNAVFLTVDDGYQDFYSVAFPMLRKYAVPVTIFLAADFINKGMWLWHDLLNFGINNTSRTDFTFDGNFFDLKTYSGRSSLKLFLDKICTSCTTLERDLFIDQVMKELNVSVPPHPTVEYAPLTWNQIREISKSGISYGAHTCTHPILSRIPSHEALREIRESKYRIEAVTQNEVLAFCYPNGTVNDFNEEVKEMVEECGFACAMSMIYGMNNLKTDKYALRRMPANGTSFAHFMHDVSGFGVLRRSLLKREKKFV